MIPRIAFAGVVLLALAVGWIAHDRLSGDTAIAVVIVVAIAAAVGVLWIEYGNKRR